MELSGRAPAPPAIEAGRDAKDEEHAMSQMGQTLHFERTAGTSAVPPKADTRLRCNIRRNGSGTDSCGAA